MTVHEHGEGIIVTAFDEAPQQLAVVAGRAALTCEKGTQIANKNVS
jgi:hypothetical protein